MFSDIFMMNVVSQVTILRNVTCSVTSLMNVVGQVATLRNAACSVASYAELCIKFYTNNFQHNILELRICFSVKRPLILTYSILKSVPKTRCSPCISGHSLQNIVRTCQTTKLSKSTSPLQCLDLLNGIILLFLSMLCLEHDKQQDANQNVLNCSTFDF